jgi:N-acetylmuramoyl-L-alanine amidase
MTYAQWLLALMIWREARDQTLVAMTGVAWVVKNRVSHPGWWGNTVVEVIILKWQFSGMTADGDPNLVDWPQETDPSWGLCKEAATKVLNGKVPDPTFGAIEYYSLPYTSPPPAWGPTKILVTIDGLTFCEVSLAAMWREYQRSLQSRRSNCP